MALLDHWKQRHPWETWQSANFGAQATSPVATEAADPDNDGQSNLAEFVFATDPQISDAPGAAVFSAPGITGMVYHRRKTTGATFHHELSSDLTNWNDASPFVQIDVPLDDGNGMTEAVSVRISPLPPGASKVFLRVRASKP